MVSDKFPPPPNPASAGLFFEVTMLLTPADHHLLRLGHALSLLDNAALGQMVKPLTLGRYDDVSGVLLNYVREVRRLTRQHAQMELAGAAGKRAFADTPTDLYDDDDDLADEYRDYLVDLAGVTTDAVRQQVGEALAQATEAGETTDEAAKRVGKVLTGLRQGRLRTIVRTEGTRVANYTRHEIAQNALDAGYGPRWMIYSAILDERTTQTCSCGHHHYYGVGDGGPWASESSPFHYNCRTIYRYGYDDDSVAGMTPWSEGEWERFKAIQAQEFPQWTQSAVSPLRPSGTDDASGTDDSAA